MTAEPGIDAGVRDALRLHVQSYEELQILLSVCAEPAATWTGASLASALTLAPHLVRTALEDLCARRVLQRTPGPGGVEAYVIQDPSVTEAVGRLAVAYKEQPLEVIRLMSANAIERLRGAALQAFADSFVIRKDKGDG